MANEVLGDALSTTMTLPVREASKRTPVKNIDEDLKEVTFTDPIAEPVPAKAKEPGKSAGELYKSDIQASVNALETGRKAQFKLESEKAVDEAERLAAKAYKASQSSALQRKQIEEDPARQEYKDALSEKSKPFIPNEQNANDLMMLFGLLNVVGFAIGSGGKENAQAAMSAMNGMLEGNRKGREALYKKEKSIFETNQKQLDSKIKQLQAFMQDNQLLYGMDKTARDQAIESEFLQTGATFMLEYYRKKGAGPTMELLEQTVKTMGKVSELNRAEEVRAEDRAREDVQKADERKFRLNVAAQQEEKERARAREKRLFEISVKEQELAAAEDRDIRNKTFDSAMAVEKNRIELLMQKENYRHAEAQSDRVMNHATAIQTETILARKAKESQDAANRAQDKTEQSARDRATEAYRAEEQKARLTAERLAAEHRKADDVHKAKMLALDARRVAIMEKKGTGADGNFLKPGAAVSAGYVADNQLKTDIEDILKDLKTNPTLVNDLKKYRVEAFLTEEGKVLNQLVSQDIPPNLRQFLTKVRDLRNNYYLNISGKAVTGGEALRSYGTVPQPGDDAAAITDKLGGMSKRVSQAISIKQQLYGLPSLNLNAGGGTSLVPGQDYSRDSQGTPTATGAKKAMPSEAKMIEYAKDPYFKGDVQKAKAYLRTLGYE